MPYLSVSRRSTVCTPSTLAWCDPKTRAICLRQGSSASIRSSARWTKNGSSPTAGREHKHRVPEPEGRGLADVDAARVGRHDASHGLEQLLLALRLEFLLEFVVGVEVVLDRALCVARDEHQLVGTGRKGFFGRVLDQRLVDDRQHLLRAGLGGRQEARAAPRHREYRRPDPRHEQSVVVPSSESGNHSGSARARSIAGRAAGCRPERTAACARTRRATQISCARPAGAPPPAGRPPTAPVPPSRSGCSGGSGRARADRYRPP